MRREWFHCLIYMELMHLITGVERFDYSKSEYAKTFARCFRQSPVLAVKALFAQRGILKLGALLAFISGRLSVRTMLAYGDRRRRHLRRKGILK